MKDPVKSALVVCDVIKPGGGPAGYVHNWQAGHRLLGDSSGTSVTLEFWGTVGRDRNKSLLSTQTGLFVWLWRLLDLMPGPIRLSASFIPWFRRRSNRTLREAIRRNEVIVFQGYQSNEFRLRYARKLGKKVVYMPHSPSIQADEMRMLRHLGGQSMPRQLYAYMRRVERNLIREADVVVFPTLNSRISYDAEFNNELLRARVEYVNSGIAFNADATGDISPPLNKDRVVYLGRYVEHKGYDLFLEAASKVSERNKSVEFVTVGDGPLKRASRCVHDAGWSENPHEYIVGATLVVVPNRIAYFDLLPLEVAALGKPMVMTCVGGSIDQLNLLPDTVGCATEDLDVAIEDALERIRRNPSWGRRNRVAFEENFTAKKMAESWLRVLGRV